jgi:hypothetical protein
VKTPLQDTVARDDPAVREKAAESDSSPAKSFTVASTVLALWKHPENDSVGVDLELIYSLEKVLTVEVVGSSRDSERSHCLWGFSFLPWRLASHTWLLTQL